MLKLGVAVHTNSDAVDVAAYKKFRATFAAPLSPSKQALQVLFSDEFDPVAWNLNLAELDDEAIYTKENRTSTTGS